MSEKEIMAIVQKEISCNSHSWEHIMRVYNLCLQIAAKERNVDMEVLKVAALLHDIGREKENKDKTGKVDHAIEGAKMAAAILKEKNFVKIEEVKHCILAHRKRTAEEPQTIEAKILFDADKIDCIGAVGIARNFMFAGQHGQRLTLDYKMPKCSYIKDVSKHNPIMEYDLALKNMDKKLYTKEGKRIGKERQAYLDDFFTRLKEEMQLN